MAGTRSRRGFRSSKIKGSSLSKLSVLDFSQGFNSFLSNDALPTNVLRKAQDARISTLGRMTTRKGASFYSDAVGEASDDTQTTTTGAADQEIGTTDWLACKITTTTAGRLTKVELNLKTNTGNAPILVEIYDDDSGKPGAKLATSSIQNSDLGGSYSYEIARFIEAPEVASATDYWIVARQQTEGTGSYHWSSTTAATTSLSSSNSGQTWGATSYDLNFRAYISTDGGAKGLFRAYKSDGTKETLLAAGTTLSKVSDVDGSLTSVSTGRNASATHYRFANINDEVFYVNGQDNPRKYDFTTDAEMAWGPSGGTSAPVASLIIAHQDLIWLNDTTDPTRLDFSDEEGYEQAASTNFIYFPSPKSPAPIVALEVLNSVLYVFTTDNKFSLFGDQKSNFQVVESPARKGTFSQESVTKTRNHIYFLSDDGVYRFNGVEDELISAPISDIIENMPNKDSAVLAVDKNRLKLFYRDSGSSENDKCLVYNLDWQAWESEDTNQFVSRAIQFSKGSDNFEFVTASSRVGQAYFFGEDSNQYNDLGTPITLELRTGYYFGGDPDSKKIWKRWYPRFEKQTRSYNVDVQTDTEFNDSPSSQEVATGATGVTWGGGQTWGGGAVYGSTKFGSDRIHLPGQSHYLQLRIKKQGVNTPVEFLGHALHFTEKRPR